MSYVTKQEVLNYLQMQTNSYIDNGFSLWLDAVETYIERYTGKEFEQVESTTRYYDGNGLTVLYLEDDLISVTSVEILESDGTTMYTLTEGASEDFVLYPYNTSPKYEIRLVSGAKIGAFLKGTRRVKITGTWGNSSTVPSDIKMAAILMLGQVFKKGIDGGDIDSVSLGDYQVTFKTGDLGGLADISGAGKILESYRDWCI